VTRAALTFEAGGDPAPAGPILDALVAAGAPATFFLDGRWADAHPELVRRIAAEGHELGNHGYAHPDWTSLDDEAIVADLHAAEAVAERLVGRSLRPWARPPFGGMDDRVLATLERSGYRAFYRDAVDGAHWPGDTTVESIRTRGLAAIEECGAVVLHTNREDSARALPDLIRALDGRELVTLSELGHVPSPRLARHPAFAGLPVRPGYVRPVESGHRWHSVNALELGAAASCPTGALQPLAELGGTGCALLAVGQTPVGLDAQPEDRRMLVLAGGVRCDLTGGYLVARPGDLFLWPGGAAGQLTALDDGRAVALVWGPA
jgi:peptidoglycan/xylan/chitin deacetylase (PgdA/CDA1 family)